MIDVDVIATTAGATFSRTCRNDADKSAIVVCPACAGWA
jgi:hypothetical protein